MRWYFWLILVLGGFIGFQIILRILAKMFAFPMPFEAAWIMDRKWRRVLLPPPKIVEQSGIKEKMQVLELGAGTGFFTVEASKRLGEQGKLYCVDIQSEMIRKIEGKIKQYDLNNVETQIANANSLPFPDDKFDVVFLVTVLGEIPDKSKAVKEIYRVLKPDGVLSITEFLPDPHYCFKRNVVNLCTGNGFRLINEYGTFFKYTVNFQKS
ncbi:MAG: class I SAM-dependent methyltransferase [Candidatus Aminicenantia bacterium]